MSLLSKLPYEGMTLLRLLSHAIAPSTLGVLARYGIETLFGSHIANVTSPTSAVFVDLPVNALGCFLMGILVRYKAEIMRIHPDIHHIIGTSFLGSLTTFASWMKQVFTMFGQGLWVSALFALVIGIEVSLFSLYVGMHFVDLILRKYIHSSESNKLVNSNLAKEASQHPSEEKQAFDSRDSATSADQLQDGMTKAAPEDKQTFEHVLADAIVQDFENGFDELIISQKDDESSDKVGLMAPSATNWDIAENEAKVSLKTDEMQQAPRPEETKPQALSDHASLILSIVLPFVVWIPMIFAAIYDSNPNRKKVWLSASLAPIGTMLRWLFSHLNGKGIANRVKWFPVGTLCSNVLATVLDAILAGLQARDIGSNLWINSVIAGVSGTLSTVSTYANEVVNGLSALNHKYLYCMLSVAIAQVLGIAIYFPMYFTSR